MTSSYEIQPVVTNRLAINRFLFIILHFYVSNKQDLNHLLSP